MLDYIVWEYLTAQKQWENHYQFEFKYSLMGGQAKADFFIHENNLVWNTKGFLYGQMSDSPMTALQEKLLQNNRFRVVRLYEDDLIYRTDYTIKQALNGQQALGKETASHTGFVAN